jgi:ankyrin repeat protein
MGNTALLQAVIRGDARMVKVLLELGADMNLKNRGGANAIVLSIIGGHHEILKLLIEKGADVNYVNAADNFSLVDSLVDAISYNPNYNAQNAMKILELLLGSGFDVKKIMDETMDKLTDAIDNLTQEASDLASSIEDAEVERPSVVPILEEQIKEIQARKSGLIAISNLLMRYKPNSNNNANTNQGGGYRKRKLNRKTRNRRRRRAHTRKH